MRAVFRELPEACDATLEIAERVELDLVYGDRRRPTSGTTCRGSRPPAASTATPTCASWWTRARRCATARSPPEVRDRIDHELGVITSMGFAGYFLIVWDLIRFAREQRHPRRARAAAARPARSCRTACASPTSTRCATG